MTHSDDETFESKATRIALQEPLKEFGRALKEMCPPGFGYALWMFDYGASGSLVYLSSAKREDMIKLVKEWLAKVEAE